MYLIPQQAIYLINGKVMQCKLKLTSRDDCFESSLSTTIHCAPNNMQGKENLHQNDFHIILSVASDATKHHG